MSELQQNPWSFTSADVLTATISASPTGLVGAAGGVVNMTATSHGLSTTVQQWVTIINPTLPGYKGFYKVIAVPTVNTATLFSQTFLNAGTILAASGGGTMILNQWPTNLRAEDMSWLNAATAADEVIVLTKDGNVIWDAIAPTAGSYSRSKPFWVNGMTIQKLSSGTLTVTVN